jgi:hypothetical protein
MESASRVMTRRALDVLKSIATGEYKPEVKEEKVEVEVESKTESASSEEQAE